MREKKNQSIEVDQSPPSQVRDLLKEIAEITPERLKKEPNLRQMLLDCLAELKEINADLKFLRRALSLNEEATPEDWEVYQAAKDRSTEIEDRINALLKLDSLRERMSADSEDVLEDQDLADEEQSPDEEVVAEEDPA